MRNINFSLFSLLHFKLNTHTDPQGRERDRQTDRQRQRDRKRERKRDRERERERCSVKAPLKRL